MKAHILFSVGFLLSLAALWAAPGQGKRPGAQKVAVLQSWNGKLANNALRRHEPGSGFVVDGENWAKLWQAWRQGEEVPKLDFDKQMVLVVTAGGPNSVGCTPTHDGQGNVRALGMATLIGGPGFGYLLLCISKEGVKTVNGKPLPGVDILPEDAPKPPRRQPGAVPGSIGAGGGDDVISSPSQPPANGAATPPTTTMASAPAIGEIKDLKPQAGVFQAATRQAPLVLRSAKEAGEHFAAEELAKLTPQVDFQQQIVLVFAWRGSGQDRLEFAVAESYPEQIFFTHKPGRTRDLRPHVRVFVLRSNVKWSVK